MLRRVIFIGLLLGLPLLGLADKSCPHYQVCFTPGQSCATLIIDALEKAQQSIVVQAYSFTSFPIAKALVQAKQRGIEVKVILDKAWLLDKQDARSKAALDYLYAHEIPLWVDYRPNIAHNKIMIIDSAQVITGSFNFTNSAEKRNAENLLLIDSVELASQYQQNWQHRFEASLPVPQKPADLAEFKHKLRYLSKQERF